MLMATGLGDAVGLGLGLALGADDALAQPTRASAAMSPRPTTRMARRITTSDRVWFSLHTHGSARGMIAMDIQNRSGRSSGAHAMATRSANASVRDTKPSVSRPTAPACCLDA